MSHLDMTQFDSLTCYKVNMLSLYYKMDKLSTTTNQYKKIFSFEK